MKRLTETQISLLRQMAEGATVHTMIGLNFRAFVAKTMKTVRLSTIQALRLAEFVEDFSKPETRWRGSHYRISANGKIHVEMVAK